MLPKIIRTGEVSNFFRRNHCHMRIGALRYGPGFPVMRLRVSP